MPGDGSMNCGAPSRVAKREFSRPVFGDAATPDWGAVVPAANNGEWLDAAELRARLLDEIETKTGAQAAVRAEESAGVRWPLAVDLTGLEHLDAAALEVLLAAASEVRGRGGRLHFNNCTASLERWFGHAGAEELLQGGYMRTAGPR